ncbi:hypothetical protein [Leptospira interrogans]|uniref:Lipoprotein n=1 Tax=Leptospira interrogans serovar Bataviae TaxID=312175 RepID=A0AAP9WT76_LEPIR|nr:hypothetical protein [Leptospira interrogans]QOI53327.1 hypothetical protein Lepto1489_23575 [Leptospira interrogans serovar Bataviae]QOI53421.1 hypothetical protein Lepto1489_24190 [Leptospira interrogans serovar Bataviae]
MRKDSRKYLGFVLIVLLVTSCDLFKKVDPDFKDYVVDGPEDFPFDPNKLPVIGVTTEEDLKKMYPKPYRIWTYKRPIPKEILGKKFNMDRIYYYVNLQTEKISGPGKSGYFGKDYLHFYLFIEKGVVAQYLVSHHVRKNWKEDWALGPYDRSVWGLNKKNNETWPGQDEDADCYWLQRRDRLQYFQSDGHRKPCPYWEAVPAWEK